MPEKGFNFGDTVFIKENEICQKLGMGKIKSLISGWYIDSGLYTLSVCDKFCHLGASCGFNKIFFIFFFEMFVILCTFV